MKVDILGVKINQITVGGVLVRIDKWLNSNNQHYIITVNPEFVVAAQDDKKFKQVLNLADLAICDGIGLVFASGFKLKRITGVDLTKKLFKVKTGKIFLLGGMNNVAKQVAKKYPNANIVEVESGREFDIKNWQFKNNQQVIKKINNSDANILLVALGQVKQEMWIYYNLDKLPNIKVAIGVGGTFDYLSGKVSRAPKWLRQLGLEWLYRLIHQPRKRIKRIFNATVKFSWLYIKNLLFHST